MTTQSNGPSLQVTKRAADFHCPSCNEPLSQRWTILTLEEIPGGVVTLSEDGRVVVANTANERLSEATWLATFLCCPCGQEHDTEKIGIEVDWR